MNYVPCGSCDDNTCPKCLGPAEYQRAVRAGEVKGLPMPDTQEDHAHADRNRTEGMRNKPYGLFGRRTQK